MPFSFQPPLHQILFFSLTIFFLTLAFYSFLFFSAPTPSLTPYPQPTFFLTSHSLHSSEFSPPLLSSLHMPLHTSAFLHRPPHAGLPTPASTCRYAHAGLIFSFSRSHGDPLSLSLSLFNFSIISSLFYILGLFNILFQFLCANKVRVLKKPMCLVVYILGLFIFSISSLCLIFWVCLFFSLFAFLENK